MKKSTTKILKLRAKDLKPHPIAQRKILPVHLRRIFEALDLDKLGVIHVVRYRIDGVLSYWIVDGQHRWAAVMEHDLGEWEITCEFHEDVKDDAGSAELFLGLNMKATMAPFDLFVNEVAAGVDVAVGVKKVVESRGLRVERYSGDGVVGCVSALKATYKKDGGVSLVNALDVAIAAWGKKEGAFEGVLLRGLGGMFATYNGQIDRDALIKKLAKFPGGAAGVFGQAKARYAIREQGLNLPGCVQLVIVGTYNRGRRAGQLA